MRAVQAVFIALGVIELCFVVLITRTAHLTWPPTRIAGVCLLLLVIAWVAIARFQLGRSFTVTPQARQLVTTGIYARIRDPIYLASPFLLIVLPIQVVRARREASALRAAFGAEYDRYRARTWF